MKLNQKMTQAITLAASYEGMSPENYMEEKLKTALVQSLVDQLEALYVLPDKAAITQVEKSLGFLLALEE